LNSTYSCDADSSALARYVIALLKKDKSDKDLKRIMIEQLDVFLSEETTRFVERLFDAIASEEYLTVPAAPLITASSAAPNAARNLCLAYARKQSRHSAVRKLSL